MAWFRRRRPVTGAGANRPTPRDDFAHLEQFAQSRRGVEAFLEPKTTVTETTALLIAHDGEWTRRRVPSVEAARAWGNRVGIPVYDVALVGYPKRMREYNERRKRAQQAAQNPDATSPNATSPNATNPNPTNPNPTNSDATATADGQPRQDTPRT